MGDTSLKTIAECGVACAIIAIGSNQARAAIAAAAPVGSHGRASSIPGPIVRRGSPIGEGTVVFAGAIVQPDTVVGRHAILNTACSVDHDCTLGDFTHIAPGSRLAGNVKVGSGSLIGLGAVIVPGRAIGSWAIVGAGSVVVHDVPDRTVVRGVPARPATKASESVTAKRS